MNAGSLAGVLILAKLLTVADRVLPVSLWLPSALLWQDIGLGLAFAALVRWAGWRPLVQALYWVLVLWIAINVPIARTLSSPLTVPMLRATGGPLADSIMLYATPLNACLVGLVLAAAALLPRWRWPGRLAARVAFLLGIVALPGPLVELRLDMRGMQRNAVTALAITGVPRVASGAAVAPPGDRHWRRSPVDRTPRHELRWLTGAAAGRHVVMITLESTGARYLRSYGAAEDPMPALTALAGRALQFDAAYAVYPESIKGLFAVLCSRHPAMDVSVFDHARSACTSLPALLAGRGYQTALFHSGRFDYLGMQEVIGGRGFETMEDAGAIGGEVESSFGVDEPSAVARILSWIDRRDRTRPFFVHYMPIAGHHPYATPSRGPFEGQGEVSAYLNALHYGDQSIATLLDGLRRRGLEDDTLFVLFGDHGEAFEQHDGNYGHTFFAFDENVRVPLIVAVPGVTTSAIRSPRVASVVDIAPTVLALLGMPAPGSYEGTTLLEGDRQMAFFFTDYALGWAGLRDGCRKYLLELESRRSHLFDVCADPDETVNVAAGEPQLVDAYRRRTLDWVSATRAGYAGR